MPEIQKTKSHPACACLPPTQFIAAGFVRKCDTVNKWRSSPRKPEIVLIRGLPGSGKTALAKTLTSHKHIEVGMYFQKNGKYVYDRAKVPEAHNWCIASAKAALEQGENVVVSNVFAKLWQLQRYIDLGYPFRIIEASGRCANPQIVPEDRIETMKACWEPLPKAPGTTSPQAASRGALRVPVVEYKPRRYTDRSANPCRT